MWHYHSCDVSPLVVGSFIVCNEQVMCVHVCVRARARARVCVRASLGRILAYKSTFNFSRKITCLFPQDAVYQMSEWTVFISSCCFKIRMFVEDIFPTALKDSQQLIG